jgi:membrane protease subunit HflK
MYVDTMEQVFANVTKVMVESRQGSNMLYLPLDKIMQNTAAVNAPAAGNGMAAPPALPSSSAPAPSAADPRNRDASRTRDRDSR